MRTRATLSSQDKRDVNRLWVEVGGEGWEEGSHLEKEAFFPLPRHKGAEEAAALRGQDQKRGTSDERWVAGASSASS